MKNMYIIGLLFMFISQLSITEQIEKRPVGRPKMIGPKLPPKTSGKVGRPSKERGFTLVNQNNDKRFILVEKNNVPMVKASTGLTTVNTIAPVKTGVQKLTSGLRFFRSGIIGSLVGYAGAQAVDMLSDAEQRKALKEKIASHTIPQNFFTNELYKQEVGLEREEQSILNNSLTIAEQPTNTFNEDDFVERTFIESEKYQMPLFLKYGTGALILTGLGYVAYKIYQKVNENYFKNKKTINNTAV